MSIIPLNPPYFTTRYLRTKKRNYANWDVFHPQKDFMVRLLSTPQGLRVIRAAEFCSYLLDTVYQSIQSFEREYLRGANRET